MMVDCPARARFVVLEFREVLMQCLGQTSYDGALYGDSLVGGWQGLYD